MTLKLTVTLVINTCKYAAFHFTDRFEEMFDDFDVVLYFVPSSLTYVYADNYFSIKKFDKVKKQK